MAMPVCCSETFFYTPAAGEPAVELPLSKSIEARRLMLAVVQARDCSSLLAPRADDCTDLKWLRSALAAYRRREKELYVGESGTALRFLTALCASTPGYTTTVYGSERLMQRPVRQLCTTLIRMGAGISMSQGFAPLRIAGARLRGDKADVENLLHSESSQYLSALLLCSELFATPLPEIANKEASVSAPYISMTEQMLKESRAGGRLPESEPDWSAASYFYLIALLSGRRVSVATPLLQPGVSVQGDAACADLFSQLGVHTDYGASATTLTPGGEVTLGEKISMKSTPDLVPAMAVAAAFTGKKLVISDIGHLSVKESNRLESITAALRSVGAEATHTAHSIEVGGRAEKLGRRPTVDCCQDHRIAMSMAPVCIKQSKGVRLLGYDCVKKSFPDFFVQIAKTGIAAL